MAQARGALWLGAVLLCVVTLTGVTHAQDVLQLGMLLPTGDPGQCLAAAQFRRAAQVAVSHVTAQTWWTDTNMQLNLKVIPSNGSFSTYTESVKYTQETCTLGTACLKAAMIGPVSSGATEHVEYVARGANMPLVGYSATSPLLSSLPNFMRTCPSDSATASALYRALKMFGWKQIAIVHDNNPYARAYDIEMQTIAQADGSITISQSIRFGAGDVDNTKEALQTLKAGLTRVVVVIALPSDAEALLETAATMGMTGKGWTWVGTEWVTELYFQLASDAAAFKSADTGGIGVSPSSGNIATFDSGSLNSMTMTAAEKLGCPQLQTFTGALAPDVYVVYAFDAVYSVARAAASARGCTSPGVCSKAFASLTAQDVQTALQTGTFTSPITGAVEFTANGDRVADDTTFSLLNVQQGAVVSVGSATGSSDWALTDTIIWAGGGTEVPSDRALPELSLVSGLFSVAISAILLSMFISYGISKRTWSRWFPGSGVMVVVGMIIGLIVHVADTALSTEFSNAVKFDAQFFSLFFLPIIIFQSGFALRKHPFFSQLGSILCYATFGTIISTFLIGFALFYIGQAGWTTRMSLEESLAFGSLISAVDPVSTLAQFGSLNVPAALGALVYGESVINDAVAIVLYRTFTGFLTEEITTGAIIGAMLSFFAIFLGSVAVGIVVALLAAVCLRCVDLRSLRHTTVAEASVLLLFSYAAFTVTEAAHLSGIVASLSCGIAMNHYTKKCLTEDGRDLSHNVFMVMADVSETIVFFQVGLNVMLFPGKFSWSLAALTIALCLIARALHVLPISFLLNRFRKDRIGGSHQFVLWLSGLRGAIAYALAVQFPSHLVDEISTVTSTVVVFTILVLGGSTRPTVRCLNIETPRTEQTHADDLKMTQRAKADSKFKNWLAMLDARIIRPLISGAEPEAVVTDSPLHTAVDSDESENPLATVSLEMEAKPVPTRARSNRM